MLRYGISCPGRWNSCDVIELLQQVIKMHIVRDWKEAAEALAEQADVTLR